jgi:hypothetical protein
LGVSRARRAGQALALRAEPRSRLRCGGWLPLPASVSRTLIAISTRPGSTAADGGGRNSPYTRVLKRWLSARERPVLSIFDEVSAEVERNTNRRQVPWNNSLGLGSRICLVSCASGRGSRHPTIAGRRCSMRHAQCNRNRAALPDSVRPSRAHTPARSYGSSRRRLSTTWRSPTRRASRPRLDDRSSVNASGSA